MKLGELECERMFTAAELEWARSLAPPEDPGKIYSIIVGVALQELLEEGEISWWRQIEHESEDDRQGIDFWIWYRDNRIPLGISSTKDHVRRRRHKYPDIPQLAVRFKFKEGGSTKPVEKLKEDIINLMKHWLLEKGQLESGVGD